MMPQEIELTGLEQIDVLLWSAHVFLNFKFTVSYKATVLMMSYSSALDFLLCALPALYFQLIPADAA